MGQEFPLDTGCFLNVNYMLNTYAVFAISNYILRVDFNTFLIFLSLSYFKLQVLVCFYVNTRSSPIFFVVNSSFLRPNFLHLDRPMSILAKIRKTNLKSMSKIQISTLANIYMHLNLRFFRTFHHLFKYFHGCQIICPVCN